MRPLNKERSLIEKRDIADNFSVAKEGDKGPSPARLSLLRPHAPAVLGVCLAHTRSIHDAEDAVQEVFLKALTKIDTLRDPSRTRAWLLQIARRTCIDLYRRRQTTSQLHDNISTPADSQDHQIERVHRAIIKLPKKYRETISLYYLDGQSCSCVAASLQITEAAVRRRLVRARLMLHDFLVEDEL